jgi:hypothetical protein
VVFVTRLLDHHLLGVRMYGIATIAVGEKSLLENKKCIESIRKHLPDIETVTITKSLDNSDMVSSRLLKTSLINHIPSHWQYCIYLDSDTRVLSTDILRIFDILQSGYDLVICPSTNQDFWHIDEKERRETFDLLEYQPLQLQGGVFGFSVNDKIREYFQYLSNIYMLYCSQDQAAIVRALHECPVKYWLLGNSFNGYNGSVVKHLFGNTR